MDDKAAPMHNHLGQIAEGLSAATIVGVFAGALPVLATLLAMAWYAAMLYDWWETRKAKKAAAMVKLDC